MYKVINLIIPRLIPEALSRLYTLEKPSHSSKKSLTVITVVFYYPCKYSLVNKHIPILAVLLLNYYC